MRSIVQQICRISYILATIAPLLLLGALCGNPSEESDQNEASATSAPLSTSLPAGDGLTDTGFVALDGRPLYEECIAEGLPLPPDLPTPQATAEPLPTADPLEDPNAGRTPAAQDELPPFDLRTVTPADTTGWILHESKCYGYSILLPPSWTGSVSSVDPQPQEPGSYAFAQSGYQVGESVTLRPPGELTAKADVSIYYAPGNADLRGRRIVLDENFYLIDAEETLIDGRPARVTYSLVRGGPLEGVHLLMSVAANDDWRFAISVYLTEPYDPRTASETAAILGSMEFR
jgi:hypothetical protein